LKGVGLLGGAFVLYILSLACLSPILQEVSSVAIVLSHDAHHGVLLTNARSNGAKKIWILILLKPCAKIIFPPLSFLRYSCHSYRKLTSTDNDSMFSEICILKKEQF
jgi:hypothetical protein